MTATPLRRSREEDHLLRLLLLVLFLFVSACGRPVDPKEGGGSGTSTIQFPHADGYKKGEAHGAEALLLGQTACNECHRPGYTAPTCASCHEGYPHAEGWLAGDRHGVGLIGETSAKALRVCADCHGVEGLSAPTCTACHTSYPHPEGWGAAGQHGAFALARGSSTVACGGCHGANLEGVTDPERASPACNSCHSTWPHPEGWAAVTGHGSTTPEALPACFACHGEQGTGGIVELACSRCHDAFPHAEDWTRGHLAWVSSRGDQACMRCHEAGEAPASMPASCGGACHTGSGG